MDVFMKKILLIICLLVLCSCGNNNKQEEVIESLDQLNGLDLGCMSGSIFDELIKEKFPDSEIVYYNSRSELLLGLTSGKIAGFVSDEPVAMMMVSQNDSVDYLKDAVGNVEYGICFSENAKDKLIQFNQFQQSCSKWINIL